MKTVQSRLISAVQKEENKVRFSNFAQYPEQADTCQVLWQESIIWA